MKEGILHGEIINLRGGRNVSEGFSGALEITPLQHPAYIEGWPCSDSSKPGARNLLYKDGHP